MSFITEVGTDDGSVSSTSRNHGVKTASPKTETSHSRNNSTRSKPRPVSAPFTVTARMTPEQVRDAQVRELVSSTKRPPWNDQRPVQRLSSLPEEIKVMTQRVERHRARAFLQLQTQTHSRKSNGNTGSSYGNNYRPPSSSIPSRGRAGFSATSSGQRDGRNSNPAYADGRVHGNGLGSGLPGSYSSYLRKPEEPLSVLEEFEKAQRVCSSPYHFCWLCFEFIVGAQTPVVASAASLGLMFMPAFHCLYGIGVRDKNKVKKGSNVHEETEQD